MFSPSLRCRERHRGRNEDVSPPDFDGGRLGNYSGQRSEAFIIRVARADRARSPLKIPRNDRIRSVSLPTVSVVASSIVASSIVASSIVASSIVARSVVVGSVVVGSVVVGSVVLGSVGAVPVIARSVVAGSEGAVPVVASTAGAVSAVPVPLIPGRASRGHAAHRTQCSADQGARRRAGSCFARVV